MIPGSSEQRNHAIGPVGRNLASLNEGWGFEVVDDSSGMAGFTSALQDAATGSGGSSGERRAEVVQSSWSSTYHDAARRCNTHNI